MSDRPPSLIPDALVPSGVRDDRQRALAQLFGEVLAGINVADLITTDPMTVDARLLPFLIVEFGAQDLIDQDWPEDVQRRLLANIWELKSLHGYDAGVKLGLELLGMPAEIRHWWEETPQGTPNTHTITVAIDELLYPDEGEHFSDAQLAAAWRMINGTKRHSQQSDLRLGVTATGSTFGGAYAQAHIAATAVSVVPPPPEVNVSASVAVIPVWHLQATAEASS